MKEDHQFALGDAVVIFGVVVGRSEFQKGQPTYLVEFDQKGSPHREWFHSADLEAEEVTDGGGI